MWVGCFGGARMYTMARASLNRCGLVVSISKILVVVVVGFGFCGF